MAPVNCGLAFLLVARHLVLIPDREPEAQFKEVAKLFIASFSRPSFNEGDGQNARDTTDKTTDKKLSGTVKVILELIANNPTITQKEMAVQLKLTEDGIYYHIDKLKIMGVLRRVGGKKTGRWEVVK
jgi:predicted HTH transcriptional regulator